MDRVVLDYFYRLGRVVSLLEGVLFRDSVLSAVDWSRIVNAHTWFSQLATAPTDQQSVPRCAVIAQSIVDVLNPLVKEKAPRMLSHDEDLKIHELLAKFHHEMDSESRDLFIFQVTDKGAYSTKALMNKADLHLSPYAQRVVTDKQREDFQLAGQCLSFELYTACGFHAMRALEEEARMYHKIVTSIDLQDVPLGAIINGDSRTKDSGLVAQFSKEGSKANSPLGLIISLLSHLNKIYRCPVMHPEMTLDYADAKQVFDLAAAAISEIVKDGIERKKKAKSAGTS